MATTQLAEISFYYLRRDDREQKLQIACRLAAQAYRRQKTVFILTPHEDDTKRIDDMLWNQPKNSFIPHAASVQQTKPLTPVRISNELPNDSLYLLINLTDDTIEMPGRAERVFELATPLERERAMARYEYYQNHNCAVQQHKL